MGSDGDGKKGFARVDVDKVLGRIASVRGMEGGITAAKDWLKGFGDVGKSIAGKVGKLSKYGNVQAHPCCERIIASIDKMVEEAKVSVKNHEVALEKDIDYGAVEN